MTNTNSPCAAEWCALLVGECRCGDLSAGVVTAAAYARMRCKVHDTALHSLHLVVYLSIYHFLNPGPLYITCALNPGTTLFNSPCSDLLGFAL